MAKHKNKGLLSERMREQEAMARREHEQRQTPMAPVETVYVESEPEKPAEERTPAVSVKLSDDAVQVKRLQNAKNTEAASNQTAAPARQDPFFLKFKVRSGEKEYATAKQTPLIEPETIQVPDSAAKGYGRKKPAKVVKPPSVRRKRKHKADKALVTPEAKMARSASIRKDIGKEFLKKLKLWVTPKHILVTVAIVLAVCLAANHLPSLIYNALPERYQTTSDTEYTITVNADTAELINQALVSNPDADFDGDGISNNEDSAPYDLDADSNGIVDGTSADEAASITEETVIQSGNAQFSVTGLSGGVMYFRNMYVASISGWIKFTGETGVPYLYDGVHWELADSYTEGDSVFVYMEDGNRLMFLPEASERVTSVTIFGKTFSYAGAANESGAANLRFFRHVADTFFKSVYPKASLYAYNIGSWRNTTAYHKSLEENPTVAPSVLGSYTLTEERFMTYDNSISALEEVYALIDGGHTAVCSLQGTQGEALGIVYGYDYLGNLYVADAETQQPCGIIYITPHSQLTAGADEIMLRAYFTFEAFSFSSKNGDRLVFLQAD